MVTRSDHVLITGGSGFTGRALAKRLRQDGYIVTSISRHASGQGAFEVDLCDLTHVIHTLAEIQPSTIVHLAGVSAPTHHNISEIYQFNVVGTANLFDAIVRAKLKPRVIIASSAQLYIAPKGCVPVDEHSDVAGRTHYTISKYAVEQIAAVYSRKLPIIITRPFNYTGPGQSTSFLVPKIVRHYAERRSEIRLGNLDLFRDLSDIERVVEAYSRLVSRAIEPTTVNICSGRAVHLSDILMIMDKIAGYRIGLISDPSLIRADEPQFMIGSPTHLDKLVGNLPNPEFSETLLRMYDAFSQQPSVQDKGARASW